MNVMEDDSNTTTAAKTPAAPAAPRSHRVFEVRYLDPHRTRPDTIVRRYARRGDVNRFVKVLHAQYGLDWPVAVYMATTSWTEVA